ncbi:MAG: lysine-2,3-aminomutase-like protein [Gammaproteobacteria bacterium]|nr:lysine-2,3-aminomutase-like protein [Gammaproteobacteria bacterium]
MKTLVELTNQNLISEQDLPLLAQVAEKFDVRITSVVAELLANDSGGHIAKQFIPQVEELQINPQELVDPIGDNKYEKVKGVIHRYPDRCLLKVVSVCPVNCRFCFRREMMGAVQKSLTQAELGLAYDYIRSQPQLWEVILTGGDPLILKPSSIAKIFASLDSISHLDVVRIHTRVPVVDPARINSKLIEALKISKAVYVILHANHPAEFTPNSIAACARLVDAGIPMLSQTVLLKGVNDDEKTLASLMKTFVRHRIKPYYLHHLDLAKGTGHFRVSIARGQALVKSLQGTISGLCQPNYMLEIPGGAGKMPIGPSYIKREGDKWVVEDYLEQLHDYSELE